jgi:hypothetical protein
MPVILAIRKLGQEDHELEGSLKQSETPASETKTNKQLLASHMSLKPKPYKSYN